MRRTTIVIIGTFAGVLLVSVALVFLISKSDLFKKEMKRQSVSSELASMDVAGYKVIKIEAADDEFNVHMSGNFHIQNETQDNRTGKFCYPKDFEKYLKREVHGDTLLLRLFSGKQPEAAWKAAADMLFDNVEFFLYADSSVNLVNELLIDTRVRHLAVDSLRLASRGNSIVIDSCDFRVLELCGEKNQPHLTIDNSRIGTLNMDLDYIGEGWPVNNSRIDIANLTGSLRSYVELTEKELGQLNWMPKGKNAELNVKMVSPASVVLCKK